MSLSPKEVLNNRCRIVRLFGQGGFGDRVRGVHPWRRVVISAMVSVVMVLLSTLLSSCGSDPDLTPSPTMVTPTWEKVAAPPSARPSHVDTATLVSAAPTNTLPPPTDTTLPIKLPEVEMVLIEAGEFLMGSTDADEDAQDDEKPQHKVYLNDYYIDKTEATNAMYHACVEAGFCTPPAETKSLTQEDYYDNPDFDDYPVIFVTWNQAVSYCDWRGARLPTEAQWEKAARGADGRIYPWGDEIDCTRANYGGDSGCLNDLAKVGSYPEGASPYGLLDMSGNVFEWVSDWYLDIFYEESPFKNPKGPESGERRIVRGGAWNSGAFIVRVANRQYLAPTDSNGYLGLRCARSP